MAEIETFLEKLRETEGDIRAQAAAIAEFLLWTGGSSKQRAAVDVGAVLRWFNPTLLKEVLRVNDEEARAKFEWLKTLSFVERYRRGTEENYNLHEATRLGWRRKMAE